MLLSLVNVGGLYTTHEPEETILEAGFACFGFQFRRIHIDRLLFGESGIESDIRIC